MSIQTSVGTSPHEVLPQVRTEATTPRPHHEETTDALYSAAHKALCSLAFALQEVDQNRQKENSDATSKECQTQEEAVERRQYLCHDGEPASSLSNGTTAHLARKRPSRSLRATIIIVSVPK